MFNPTLAQTRFGTGTAPGAAMPPTLDIFIAQQMDGTDPMPRAYPRMDAAAVREAIARRDDLRRALGQLEKGTNAYAAQENRVRGNDRDLQRQPFLEFRTVLQRGVASPTGLRERLVWFWSDHFTAAGRDRFGRLSFSDYEDRAIRPHVLGRFGDMLQAVVFHPVMLRYLDQDASVGPNSPRGRRGEGGLNENLAREVLELHTLGVDGPYGQQDVRQLAELFTGMTITRNRGFRWREDWVELGPEEILGKSYGSRAADMAPIAAALHDLALHPATARHLAGKMARHFLRDDPPAAVIDALAQTYSESGGNLRAMTEAMLRHPMAWEAEAGNVKLPLEFIVSSLRAVGVGAADMLGWNYKAIRDHIHRPMSLMGHAVQQPTGPDGLAEADAEWITPQGLAARIDWAFNTLPVLAGGVLPDPQDLLDGGGVPAGERLRFAVGAAESRGDAVGLILSSPGFQRR